MTFSANDRGPQVAIPACPALADALNAVGNRPDAWFLLTLEQGIRAVLGGQEPGYGVASDEIAAEVSPERVEVVISAMEDGSAASRGALPTQACLELLERWKRHLSATRRPSDAA